jgi:hypothetical protein
VSRKLLHRRIGKDYWNAHPAVFPGGRQMLKEIALLTARENWTIYFREKTL